MRVRHRHESTAAGTGAPVFWHETAPPPPATAPLTGEQRADVAIVGGGFTGLWTAIALKEAEPSLDVVVLEAATAGHGASGRNGGFAMCLLDFSLAHLHKRFGTDGARAAHLAVERSIEEMGAQLERYGIDCDWTLGGLVMVATSAGQLQRVEADLEAARTMGLETSVVPLGRDEVRARVDSPTYLGGAYEPACAVLHPAKLNRGLAEAAIGLGVRLHQRSPVLDLGEDGTVRTPDGLVRAEQVVVATNAWGHEVPGIGRKVRALYTYVVLTEPLTDAQWARVGWDGFEGIEDKRNYVHYYRRTADGRILWGGTDALDHGGRIGPKLDSAPPVRRKLEATFRRTFPQLSDVRFSHHWGGPIGISATFVPIFGTLPGGRVHYGVAYNGHGVAPSHTGGKVLRDLVLGRRDSELLQLPFVGGDELPFPVEPLATVGSALTRRALLRQDARLDRGAMEGATDPWLLRAMEKLS